MHSCAWQARTVIENLQETVRGVLCEVMDAGVERTDDELAAAVKARFLDRWYRFAPFGVTTRSELERMTVAVTWTNACPPGMTEEHRKAWFGAEWDSKRTRSTTVSFKDTPLAKVPHE